MLKLQDYVCLTTSRADNDQRVIPLTELELLLGTIERCFVDADTEHVASMFWTPCVCYFHVADKVIGAVQTTSNDVVQFFESLRRQLNCYEMRFVVLSTPSGNTHEYGWKSDIGSGSATVSWRRNRAGAWQIVYMDIKCNCVVPKAKIEADQSACLVDFVQALVRQRGDRLKRDFPEATHVDKITCSSEFIQKSALNRGCGPNEDVTEITLEKDKDMGLTDFVQTLIRNRGYRLSRAAALGC
eukprot:TRINITY_DN63082_c0_g1_i1.p1 TRINITY_DN63082_c0_g1~~TRINITY_DN63082_c0_g1_i1.p1  ORF type:complete len:242 (-),score=27.08 TRINITY_DN63082_c0_g1_i1:342-1067(-)